MTIETSILDDAEELGLRVEYHEYLSTPGSRNLDFNQWRSMMETRKGAEAREKWNRWWECYRASEQLDQLRAEYRALYGEPWKHGECPEKPIGYHLTPEQAKGNADAIIAGIRQRKTRETAEM